MSLREKRRGEKGFDLLEFCGAEKRGAVCIQKGGMLLATKENKQDKGSFNTMWEEGSISVELGGGGTVTVRREKVWLVGIDFTFAKCFFRYTCCYRGKKKGVTCDKVHGEGEPSKDPGTNRRGLAIIRKELWLAWKRLIVTSYAGKEGDTEGGRRYSVGERDILDIAGSNGRRQLSAWSQ